MVFTKRDKLNIIFLSKPMECISFDTLEQYLKEQPTNTIYIEYQDELYGIISMGDISNASYLKKREVNINLNFTKVAENDYMKALSIFKEKESINSIPVIDSSNHLIGEYLRWNDSLYLSYAPSLHNKYASLFFQKNSHIATVKPNSTFFPRDYYTSFIPIST